MTNKNILAVFFAKILTSALNRYQKLVYYNFRQRYQIADTFYFNGCDVLLYGDGEIICGENSYIGDRSTLHSAKGYKLVIGRGCQISSNVRIFTQTAVADADFSQKPVSSKFGNVIVGNYCWIGANVLINPGVTVGDNAVIGANSVVTKDVPAAEIWGGVPARFIRKKLGIEFIE
ncbi:MAG: acyltransferase [Methylotenera sp.]